MCLLSLCSNTNPKRFLVKHKVADAACQKIWEDALGVVDQFSMTLDADKLFSDGNAAVFHAPVAVPAIAFEFKAQQ